MLHVTYYTLGEQTGTVLCDTIESGLDNNLVMRRGMFNLSIHVMRLVSIKSVMTKMSKAAVKANHTRKVKPTTPEA